MSFEPQPSRARRYLLGDVDEAEGGAIEIEYLRDPAALDRVAEAEDDLIEDYLAGRLQHDARARFEHVYLAAPHHRTRLATMRRLRIRAAVAKSRWIRGGWPALAVAAALLLGIWIFRPLVERSSTTPESSRIAQTHAPSPATMPPARGTVAPAKPHVFAITISPLAVRGAEGSPPFIIPPDTDFVSVRLEGDDDARLAMGARAAVRVVGAPEVWQGTAEIDDPQTGILAHVDVPARVLTPNDYLIDVTSGGVVGRPPQQEYFLRVRAR